MVWYCVVQRLENNKLRAVGVEFSTQNLRHETVHQTGVKVTNCRQTGCQYSSTTFNANTLSNGSVFCKSNSDTSKNITNADPVSVLTCKTRPVLITTLTSQCAVCRLYLKFGAGIIFFNFSTTCILNVNNKGTKNLDS